LLDHQLGVLPHVFVTPFAVAEADQLAHLGKQNVEGTAQEQRLEPLLGVVAQHDPVETRANVGHSDRRRGDPVGRASHLERPVGRALFGNDHGTFERVQRPGGAPGIVRRLRLRLRIRHGHVRVDLARNASDCHSREMGADSSPRLRSS
jgi:hypothetical protein